MSRPAFGSDRVRSSEVLGPVRPVPAAANATAEMSSARLDNPEVLALKDQRKPATAVKLLRERTGLDLGDAKRLVDRLP